MTAAASGNNTAGSAPATSAAQVLELRQYALRPNRFVPFTELFERELIEPQEAVGMTVVGQFRDLDDPDRFVWLRGFPDRPNRRRALEAFYGGALWQSLRDQANASFVDTDNVLLLRPLEPGGHIDLDGMALPAPGSAAPVAGLVIAAIYPVAADDAAEFRRWFGRELKPALLAAGIRLAGCYETDPAPNDFARLPVREGEHVFVWMACFAERRAGEAALHDLTTTRLWRDTLGPGLSRRLGAEPQLLRLEPTARSRLRG